jgi:hypothetical protein
LPNGITDEPETTRADAACPDGLSACEGKTSSGMIVGFGENSGFIDEVALTESAPASIFADLMLLPDNLCERTVVSYTPIFVDARFASGLEGRWPDANTCKVVLRLIPVSSDEAVCEEDSPA